MRSLIFLLLILMAGPLLSLAQSLPDKGSVAGNVYTNKTLGLTWEFPASWQVQNSPTTPTSTDQVLVQLLPNGPQSGESVVLSCINPNIFDGDAVPWFDDKVWKSIPAQPSFTLANGIPLHRYDFQSAQPPTRFLTSLSGPRNNYGVKIILIANSASDTDEMIKAIELMKGTPDWPPSALAETSYLTPTGEIRTVDRSMSSTGMSGKRESPTLAKGVAPIYPPKALKAHIQGSVTLLVHISGDTGNVKDMYVEYGNPVLIPAALTAVSQWHYSTRFIEGTPPEIETQVNVRFHIDKSYDNPPTCRGSLEDCIKGVQH